jgi:hypothetical protein
MSRAKSMLRPPEVGEKDFICGRKYPNCFLGVAY